MRLAFVLPLLAAMGLQGCVNPEVLPAHTARDASLTCSEIDQQLAALESIRSEAERGRSVSAENVAAAVLFWPAVVGNNINAREALTAANERQAVLVNIREQRRCS